MTQCKCVGEGGWGGGWGAQGVCADTPFGEKSISMDGAFRRLCVLRNTSLPARENLQQVKSSLSCS